MKRALLILLCLLVAPLSAAAQTVTVEPGEAYRVQWTHDSTKEPTFALVVDGARVKTYAAGDLTVSAQPDAGGLFTYSAPGVPFTKGTHTIAIVAFNAAGENSSAPLSVSSDWTTPPSAPGHVTVIKITVEIRQPPTPER